MLNVSSCCRAFVPFRTQTNVLHVQGKVCNSLRALFKYLRSHHDYVHARLYLDELWGIQNHVSPLVTILILEPPLLNWMPYAVVKSVAWLTHLHRLNHLEMSLDRDAAISFISILEDHHLTQLEALVVSTNYAAYNFWSALTQAPRLALRVLCVNGFRMQHVCLHNIRSVRFLWICRPYRHNLHRFLAWVVRDLRYLKYLATRDFTGLGHSLELEPWMALLQGDSLPELEYWDAEGCGITDLACVCANVQGRSQSITPLCIQGIRLKDHEWSCGKHAVVSKRRLGLDKYHSYRCLGVLEQDMKTFF